MRTMTGSSAGMGGASNGTAPSAASGERQGFDEVAKRLRELRRSVGLEVEDEPEPEPEPEVTLDAAVTADDVTDGGTEHGADHGATAPVAGSQDVTTVHRPGALSATVGPAVLVLGWIGLVALVVLAV